MKRRARRTASASRDQLSFFDPDGELPALRDELRRLETTQAHYRHLQEGLERSVAACDEIEAEIARIAPDAENAQVISGQPFAITLHNGAAAEVVQDRLRAGAAIKARILEALAATDRTQIELGTIAGFRVEAAAERLEDGQFVTPWLFAIAGEQDGPERSYAGYGQEFICDNATDPETVIAGIQEALQTIAKELGRWRTSLVKSRSEVTGFQDQLKDLGEPDGARLDAVRATIHNIETSGGLFGAPFVENTTAIQDAGKQKEADDERAAVRALAGNVRDGEEDLPDRAGARRIRSHGEGRRAQGASGVDRQPSGGSLPDADGTDAGDSRGDRRSAREGGPSQPGVEHGTGIDARGHRPHLATDDEAARRRDRARLNFRIGPADPIGEGTAKEKVAANIEAIRTLKLLAEEQREATEAERRVLVKYVGWGAFAQAMFDPNPNSRNASIWKAERQALADLITTDEWEAARASTLNAHYTSAPVIRGMWQALAHLGFTGGRVLEPAAGIGHFIGLAPGDLASDTDWTGIELDPLTGGIAKALYPGADIRIQGFETAIWPDGFFDLAISNVPFGDYTVADTRYRPMSIHDYFFVRSLDKVRPGGLVAFITSRYSLDKETDLARREIARRAEFLGAIRLPGGERGAFAKNAGTEVTTDIIFLKRRIEGDRAGDERWLSLATVETPDGPTRINRYFAENPEMMLGEMRLQRSMYSAADPVLIGPVDAIETGIANAARRMAVSAFVPRGTRVHKADAAPIDTNTDGIREGAFYLKDGQIYRKVAGIGEPQSLTRVEAEKVRALMALRDLVNELLAKQASGDPGDRRELRDRLNHI